MAATAFEPTEPQAPVLDRIKTGYLLNVAVSSLLSLLIVTWFYLTSEDCRHWFVLPLLFCGVLIGADAVGWLRGKLDPFDPVGIIGLMIYLRYFVGTFLNVTLDYWLAYITPPPDWRPWVGGMALLNLAGIVIYQFSRYQLSPRNPSPPQRSWVVRESPFFIGLFLFLAVAAIFQLGTYLHLGGLSGFISAYETRSGGFEGMGAVFMVSECFPILVMMGYAVYRRGRQSIPSWGTLLVLFGLFFVMKIFFGGLRGSRAETIFAILWAAGIIHFFIRPVPKRMIVPGVAVMMIFVYAYGFYKGAGLDGLKSALVEEERVKVEKSTGRTKAAAWLSPATQPYTLYRLMDEDRDYQYAYGRTYVGAIAKLVPSALWPSRPPGKTKEGTELFHGPNVYPRKQSSQVWGLAGEAMLNFGPAAAPFAFLILGVAVAATRRWMVRLPPGDSRLLVLPFFVGLCVLLPESDSDNVVFYFFKNGTVPLLLVWIGSAKFATDAKGRE